MHPSPRVWLPAITALAACLLAGCSTLDFKAPRSVSHALADPGPTALGRAAARVAREHPGQSGFRLLGDGVEAFTARLALIEAAEKTLDLQYYIFHGDDSGKVILDRLLAAADRGVRVRLLLDDIYLTGADQQVAILDQHPSLEVRYFNPWKYRGGGLSFALGFLFDSGRLNHRMHNKMFAADNSAVILGGRNIGDEYFGLNPEFVFSDLDVLALGPAATEASQHFDRYWNSVWAVPVAARRGLKRDPGALEKFRQELAAHREKMRSSPFGDSATQSEFARQFREQRMPWSHAPATVIADDPAKVKSNRKRDRKTFLLAQLRRIAPQARQELLVSSPYFVPGDAGVRFLTSRVAEGVAVRVLTNARESSDAGVVHSGYAPYRPALLRGGVRLHELKRVSDRSREMHEARRFGSANASLHTKCLVGDRRHVFIGSLNLDPRSLERNTETGVVIDSPELGEVLGRGFDRGMGPETCYQLDLRPGCSGTYSRIEWRTTEQGKTRVFRTEPGTTWFQRLKVKILGWLPIESQI